MFNHLLFILPTLLQDLPLFLVEIVGVVLALVRWNRHPRASLWAVLGLVLMFFARVVRLLSGIILPVLALESRRPGRFLAGLASPLQIFLTIFEAIGLLMVLIAVFTRREAD